MLPEPPRDGVLVDTANNVNVNVIAVGGRASDGCCVLTQVAMPGTRWCVRSTLRVPCRYDHA